MLELFTGGTTGAVALDISKAFDRVWHAGLLYKHKSSGISGQLLGVLSSFLSNRWIHVVLDGKFSQEYPVNAGAPQGSILGSTLYSKCDQTSDLWQQLKLASEIESDLRDTDSWSRK